MRNQWIDLDIALADQAKEFLHVAILSPTHIRERIIAALFLIAWVVAAGAIRARHVELNFFEVHVVPREAHFNRANHDDSAAIAANIHRQLARRRGF